MTMMAKLGGVCLCLGGMAVGCIDASQRVANCPTTPGGATAAASPAAQSVKGCAKGTRPAADGVIDDFEDGNTQVSQVGSRDGYWFSSKDPSGSTIEPSPLAPADEGAGGSKKSMRVFGKTAGSSDAWGAMLGSNFLGGNKALYDGSKFVGISFKAKVGPKSTKKFRFKVGDVNTHPDGGVCKSCWNHFGKDMTFTNDWQEYKIPFAEMKQEAGWGDRKPAIDATQLLSINWSVKGGGDYDLWIDDVQFFECM